MKSPAISIDVWSDYVCPFCYLVEPALIHLEEELGERLELTWRAFELRPEPIPTLEPHGQYLHEVWGSAVYPMAEERGMTLHLPPVQPRSRLAHETAALARARGRFEPVNDAIFRAFFVEGQDIGDPETLGKIGARAGLEEAEIRRVLGQGRMSREVLQDEERAAVLGIAGVPAMVIRAAGEPIERGVFIEGAQPEELIRAVIERVTSPGGSSHGATR